VSHDFAAESSLSAGDRFTVSLAGRVRKLVIAGVLKTGGPVACRRYGKYKVSHEG
jgi:hypothetical protein